ncbi:hypothetical protein PVK06_047406 [Gossypium arboreum]|uniref:MULE transposase domain-containing protein n=1 Tax=Gossypium arboreum TaxID=29729 RepID=A0ABR0MD83_GOSAR|nr:hypothetical protein PVK06_047406 [Gossypium arboreum]
MEIIELLPMVEHRVCARHLYAKWRKANPGGDLQQAFWAACKSYITTDFEDNINKIDRIKYSSKITTPPALTPPTLAPPAPTETTTSEASTQLQQHHLYL